MNKFIASLLTLVLFFQISHCLNLFSLTNLSANDVSYYTTISDVTVDTDCCQLAWSRVVLAGQNETYSIPEDAIIAGYSINSVPVYFAKIKDRQEQAIVNFATSTVHFLSGSNNTLPLSSISILTNPDKCVLIWVRQSPCANLNVHRSKLYPSFKGDLFVFHNWTSEMTTSTNHYLEPDLCDESKNQEEESILCIDCYESLRNHINFELTDVIFNISSLKNADEKVTLNQVDITNIGTADQPHEVSLLAQMVLFVKIDLPNWKLPSYFSILNVTDDEYESNGMKQFITLLTHGLDSNKKEYVKEKMSNLLTNGQLFISERRTINRFNQTINFTAKSVTTQTISGTLVQGSLPLKFKFKIYPKNREEILNGVNDSRQEVDEEKEKEKQTQQINGPSTLTAKKIKSFLARSQFPDMEKVSIENETTLAVTYEGTIRLNDVVDEKLVIRSTRFSE